MNPKQLVKQSETLLRCHSQITSDQNLEEELYRPRLQNPWYYPLKPSLKYKWLQDTKWNNAQLYILQIISPLHYRHFFTFLRACKTYRWQTRCFVGAGYQSKYCLRESRSVGATGLIHWFILEYRKRQEMNFCFDTLNIFVYNCSAYFRKFWKSIIQIYSDTLFSSFVCKVKFLRLSTLSHLLFTWSASHNWVRHKNDKPTTQMPHVGGPAEIWRKFTSGHETTYSQKQVTNCESVCYGSAPQTTPTRKSTVLTVYQGNFEKYFTRKTLLIQSLKVELIKIRKRDSRKSARVTFSYFDNSDILWFVLCTSHFIVHYLQLCFFGVITVLGWVHNCFIILIYHMKTHLSLM